MEWFDGRHGLLVALGVVSILVSLVWRPLYRLGILALLVFGLPLSCMIHLEDKPGLESPSMAIWAVSLVIVGLIGSRSDAA